MLHVIAVMVYASFEHIMLMSNYMLQESSSQNNLFLRTFTQQNAKANQAAS